MSQPSNRDEPVTSTKSFEISKHAVLAANRRIKANRGAAGVGGLGFTFKPRASRNRRGKIFTGFLPAASRDAIIRMLPAVKSWQPQRLTPATIEQLSARYNKVQGGWWNYYGNFYPSVMDRISFQVDRKLARWTRRKQKRLAGHRQQSALWLQRVAHHRPRLFIHWQPLSSRVPIAGVV